MLQAGALAESGSIYVLDMGEPVKIMDLAKQLIRFYGYEPGVNMDIKIVGLRPGEKTLRRADDGRGAGQDAPHRPQ